MTLTALVIVCVATTPVEAQVWEKKLTDSVHWMEVADDGLLVVSTEDRAIGLDVRTEDMAEVSYMGCYFCRVALEDQQQWLRLVVGIGADGLILTSYQMRHLEIMKVGADHDYRTLEQNLIKIKQAFCVALSLHCSVESWMQ